MVRRYWRLRVVHGKQHKFLTVHKADAIERLPRERLPDHDGAPAIQLVQQESAWHHFRVLGCDGVCRAYHKVFGAGDLRILS